MKKLGLVLATLLVAFPAFAAQLETVRRFRSHDLSAIQAEYEKAFRFALVGDNSGYTNGVRIVEHGAESFERTIKQVIYRTNTGYARPDRVDVFAVLAGRRNVTSAVTKSLEYLQFRSERPAEILADEVYEVVSANRDLEIYRVAHAGSFGGAVGLVVYDPDSEEILVAGSVYTE